MLITREDSTPSVILDTKWKRLSEDDADSKNGVRPSDMYQLYAHRYSCQNNLLVFPRVPGVKPKMYTIEGGQGFQLRTATMDLSFDLLAEQQRHVEQLQGLLCPCTSHP